MHHDHVEQGAFRAKVRCLGREDSKGDDPSPHKIWDANKTSFFGPIFIPDDIPEDVFDLSIPA